MSKFLRGQQAKDTRGDNVREIQTSLPVGAVIQGQYIVESLLGKGDFGNVYLVRDQRDKQKFFALAEVINPNEQEKYRFTLEYVSLAPLNHRALPHVQYIFNDDELSRAYLLMGYIEGPNLEILQLQQPEKRFPLPQVMTIMTPVIDAVTYLHHRNPPIIHRNINPATIVPANVDEPVLVMLGIVKEHGSTTTALHYFAPGYGATEQYREEFSARTDLYGLGATFYTLLTGIIPPDALYRSTQLSNGEIDPLKPLNEVIPTIPTFMTEAIQQAMSINAYDRFSSLEQFREALWSPGRQFSLRTSGSMPSNLSSSPMASKQAVERPAPAPVPSLPLPVESKQAVERPAPASVPKQLRAPHTWKLGTLWPMLFKQKQTIEKSAPASMPKQSRAWKLGAILTILALLISLGVGVGFWSHARSLPAAHSVTPAPTMMRSTPTPAPTSTSVSSIYPKVTGTYNGTIYNIPLGLTTTITLTRIQQSQREIRGYFTGFQANGLKVNEPFSGMIDAHGHIHFTLAEYAGQITLSFEGAMETDGTLAGSYCNLGQNGQCAGEYGLWSVVPGS